MPWWTWVALGIFIASVVAGGIIAVVALRTMAALQSVGERLATAFEDLAAKSDELERQAEGMSLHVESAEPHFEHLRLTLDRFSVLTWAIGDVAKTIGRWRSAVLVHK